MCLLYGSLRPYCTASDDVCTKRGFETFPNTLTWCLSSVSIYDCKELGIHCELRYERFKKTVVNGVLVNYSLKL